MSGFVSSLVRSRSFAAAASLRERTVGASRTGWVSTMGCCSIMRQSYAPQLIPTTTRVEIRSYHALPGRLRAMPEQRDEAQEILEGVHPAFRRGPHLFRTLPGGDRCKMCASPFGSVGGPIMRLFGKGRWPKNPKYCAACFNQLVTQRQGAEVDASLLFADVRGSTALAETMRPSEFRNRMDGFFRIASAAVVEH